MKLDRLANSYTGKSMSLATSVLVLLTIVAKGVIL